MATAAEIVILLSLGSFQVQLPQAPQATSPVFADSAQGVQEFMGWIGKALPSPRFNQPPTRICVVGAVPFPPTAALYLPRPLWESRQPLRQLEPYSATFHYLEPPAGAPAPKPRTLRDAVRLCAEVAKAAPPRKLP
ncbi:MAG: hypothetical protein JNJ71_08780 [Rubrivivax sp.]|nr:hypothetical protein [Rubrivivax sp.]